jgi:hypothetical protein
LYNVNSVCALFIFILVFSLQIGLIVGLK